MVSKTGLTLQERTLRRKKPKVISEFFKSESNVLGTEFNDNHSIKCLKRAIIVNSFESVKNYKNVHLNDNSGKTFFERYTQPIEENIVKHLKYAIKNKHCKFIILYLNDFKISQTTKLHNLLCSANRKHIIIISKKYTDFFLKYRNLSCKITKIKNINDNSASNIVSIIGDLNTLNQENEDLSVVLNTKDTQFNKPDLRINAMFYRPKKN